MPFGKRLGILGMGRMGRCLAQGLISQKTIEPHQMSFSTRHLETRAQATHDLGLKAAVSNLELVKNSDLIVLAVKPQNMLEVLREIGPALGKGKTLISIVASVSTTDIETEIAKGTAVLRAMPNTPAFVGAGMTALCAGKSAAESDLKMAKEIFKSIGKVLLVDEKHMDAVTGLSGCGPAYLYVVLESLTDAGIKVGLSRDVATQLAGQTVLGAAQMLLETGRHPAALKDEVTTPAGCTIDGLLELEEGKLRVTLIKAVVQATKRAKALAKKAKV
ncbi:MAG: pyrroline-5-carboxylate reductase [Proteobacteria bacterium]|nr:pyrroline-5-carboxylate reductase [Pseudomonadota bacterium]NDC24209.1 pyrroline-5-carboxylate reductase [Pseudomonadota bacterium]NDD04142.1 pyrroline-5-carboxylate reductase [Pseudomonadota bacterium]NDG26070.1 pyrroline-5-carboxylate reductase [Pseudomonadota bacterium]